MYLIYCLFDALALAIMIHLFLTLKKQPVQEEIVNYGK